MKKIPFPITIDRLGFRPTHEILTDGVMSMKKIQRANGKKYKRIGQKVGNLSLIHI